MPSEKYYKVNEFAKLCGVTPRTLKYYETRGLIRPALVGEMDIGTTAFRR